jgi:three-Cys-motif partner protein
MKPVAYYKDREQTYLKHFFLERYLETVAYHIGSWRREFAYVDCFSGPWRTGDQELGDTSIRIALERLNSVSEGLSRNKKHPAIRALFVEKSPPAFSELQRVLEQHRGAIETTALPRSFEENIDQILDHLGSVFAFFFVDPTGWTGFAMDNLRPILKRSNGEVMINFMFDFINRFLNFQSPSNEESLDRLFGTREWRSVRDEPDLESALLDLYVTQVRTTGSFPYATSTRILKPLQERTYFHLVYATRNPKGVEKFRDVEKKTFAEQQAVREKAQREHRERKSGQSEIDFGPDFPSHTFTAERDEQLRKAKARLMVLLRTGPMPYDVLQPRILELPLVWNTDLNEILAQGRRTGQFEITGLGPRERKPKKDSIVRLKPEKAPSSENG